MNRRGIAGAALLVGLAMLSGCGPEAAGAAGTAYEQAPEDAAPREMLVRTRDYHFEAPDTVVSGPTTIRLVNEGPDFHHVWLVRLAPGRTLAELVEYMEGGHPTMPEWAVDAGGPNTPGAPGEETSATVDLQPGEYAIICVIPGMHDGLPHTAKGMVRSLTVVPSVGHPARMPEADLVMILDDYSFETDGRITAGRRTIRVENVAEQAHEVVVVRLEPGRSGADFLNFLGNPVGAPPGRMIGGVTGIARGEVNTVTLEFEPGDYALICFIPDAGDGAPHFVHGMIDQITVE
jgi:plastocyanin